MIEEINKKLEKGYKKLESSFMSAVYALLCIGILIGVSTFIAPEAYAEIKKKGIKLKWYQTPWGIFLISAGITGIIGVLVLLLT